MAVTMLPEPASGWTSSSTTFGTVGRRRLSSKAYPSIGSLANVYGTITFILEHPKEVEAYLEDQERIFEEFKARHPMPADMIER